MNPHTPRSESPAQRRDKFPEPDALQNPGSSMHQHLFPSASNPFSIHEHAEQTQHAYTDPTMTLPPHGLMYR